MIIHLPAVYFLPGCTSSCTLNVSKKSSGQLHLLIYTYCFLQNTGHWIHCSNYTNICTRQVMDQAVPQCLPCPGQSSAGSSFAELTVGKPQKKVHFQMVVLLWVNRLPSPSLPQLLLTTGHCAALCLQFWEGVRERALPSYPRLCSSASCPQENGLLMFVWQPNAAPYIQHPLPPVCPLLRRPFSMWTWLFASQPSPRKLHSRPQESSSAQPPDSLTGVHLNCLVTEGFIFRQCWTDRAPGTVNMNAGLKPHGQSDA